MSEESFFAKVDKGVKEQETVDIGVKNAEEGFFAKVEEPDPAAIQATSNINATQDITPDQEAENYQLAKDSGFPISTVRHVPHLVKERSSFLIPKSKPLQAYFARSHTNAAISKDDVPNLEKAELSINKNKTTFERLRTEDLTFGGVARTAGAAAISGIAQIPKSLNDLFEFFAPFIVDKRKLDFRDKNLEKIHLSEDLQNFMRSKFGTTKAEELVASSFETLGTMGAFAVTGGGAAVLPGISTVSGIEKTTEALREGAERREAVTAGIVQAGTEYLTEKIPIDILRGPATSFLRKWASGAIFDIPGELIATSVEMKVIEEGILGAEERTEDQYKQALIDTALVSIITTSAATTPTHIIQKIQGKVDAAIIKKEEASLLRDKRFSEILDDDRKSISETLTAQRSRDHAKEFVELVGRDEDVFISSEGMKHLFQTHTKEETDALLEKIGVDPDKARNTIATGEDTTVKASDILTLPEEEYNIIKEDVKPAPGAYTQREIAAGEANEDIENLTNVVKEDVEKSNKINAEIERIQKETEKAGLTKEVAENAPVLIQGISNKLEIEGVDPVEFLKKITVKKERFADIKALIDKGKKIFQAEIKEPSKIVTPRGMLTIEKEAYTVSLFEDADLSTVLHEVGHIALNEYSNLEIEGIASESLKSDMKTIRNWVGAKEGQDFNRDQIEQFARGFEAYLLEGKAPSSGLRAAFERFKRWLTETYKSVKGLDVTLNKDVRQVFDRMLSTNIEVEAAAAEGGFIVKTVDEMDALGMTPQDKLFATRLMEQVTNKAQERLTKDRNKGLRSKRKEWKVESAIELKEENPVYNIINLILEDNNQINRAEFIERYGEESIDLLPDRRVLARPTKDKAPKKVLSVEGENALEIMRSDIEQGEPPKTIFPRDHEGNIIREKIKRVPSTFPEYFKGFETKIGKKKIPGLKKKETLNIIDRALTGKSLTERQLVTLEALSDGFKDEVARQAGVSPDDIFTESLFKTVTGEGKPIDQVAAFYEYDNANSMMDEFFATPKFAVAVNQRVEEKQAAHDSQFLAEDYIVDLKEYRDYLDIMARYIGGKGIDEAAVSAGIQRNISRWEKEAAAEIKEESPDLTGAELEREVGFRVQEKIDAFQQRKARPSVIAQDTIKRLARETMAAKTVREARKVDKYLSAMKKASNNERRAILRQDWGAASEANELARFNYEMAGLSVKIREEVDTILKRAKRIGKPKKKETVDLEHKEAILHLIDRYKLASLVPSDPLTTPDYAALFAGDEYNNDGFQDTDFLKSNVRDFRDLSTEFLRDLDNAIRYLEKVGRIEDKKTLSDGVTLIQDIVNESTGIMDTMKVKKVWEKGSLMRRLTDPARSFFSRLDSLTFTAKSVDGYTNLGKIGKKGPIERWVIDRIKEASSNLTKDGVGIQAQIAPHLNQISKTVRKWHKQFGNNITIEGVPVPELMREVGQTKGWKAQQIFAVALNTGNRGDASNYSNLLAGYDDLTAGQVESIKDMLSVEDMDAVQGIWDTMESLFPKTNKTHVNIKNFNMPKVEATPFTFKGRNYRGGYYPIRHDRELSFTVDERGKKVDLFESDEAAFTTPYAKSGHTIKRIRGVALPILLDLSVIDSHFRDTLQYIHFAEVIADSDKITRDANFRKSATKVLGKDVYNTIRPALKHIANPKREGLDKPGARGIEWMRSLSTAYVLAWNTGVAIKQPLSTFGAIRDMGGKRGLKAGAKAYFNGFISAFASPSVHYQKMIELSPYMRDRLTSFDRELKSQFLKLSVEQRGVYFGDKKVTWQDVKNFGFWQIRVADTTTVLPIWHGAFNDKLNADQSNLQEAISYADDIVRNSQPSAQPLDLSSWQRDGGAIRLFSQFQTFTVGKYGQRQRLFYRAWRNGTISNVDYAWFNFMDAFVPLVAINLLQSIIWGNDLGDEETQKDMAIDVLQSWALMGVPIVSSVARSMFRYGDPFDSPVLETANKAVRGVVSGAKGLADFEDRKKRERALWGIAHTASILSGVPVSKMVQRAERGAEQRKGVPGIKYLVPAPPSRK